MSEPALIQFSIPGQSTTWAVRELRGSQQLHQLGHFELRCLLEKGDPPSLEQLLTEPALLRWSLESGDERKVQGIIDVVEKEEETWVFHLVPQAQLLSDSVDYQVFVDKDALEIATQVLSEHGIDLESRVQRTLPKLPQTIQVFETDLDFVSRLLADEGIVWFEHDQKKDLLVAVDDAQSFEDAPGDPLPIVLESGLIQGPSVYAARLSASTVVDKCTLRDFDFHTPMLDLTVDVQEAPGHIEQYEYRGGFADPSLGKTLAKIRLEEARQEHRVLQALTNCRALAPGRVLQLQDAEHASLQGRWLITRVEHRASEQNTEEKTRRYEATFWAVPAEVGFRPKREPLPVNGLHHAIATGSQGAELHTNEDAQVKARFRWDRRGKQDDSSSAWMRSMQPPTSGGFFLPRVGWELLLGDWHSYNEPLVLGRLDNGKAPPAHSLPAKKIVSAFGSLTTPGGGSLNAVLFDDSAGSEALSFVASKDYNERTEKDKVTGVGADDSWTIGGDDKNIVGQVYQVEVQNAQDYHVGASRTANVTGNRSITAATETVKIGGLRTFNIGGDQASKSASMKRVVGAAKAEAPIEHSGRLVGGASSMLVGGSWNIVAALHSSVQVGGASKELVAGAKNISARQYGLSVLASFQESYASLKMEGKTIQNIFQTTAQMKVGGSATIQGSYVVFSATSKLVVKAGGMTLTITPSEVKIDGKYKGSGGGSDKDDESYD